MYEAFVVWCCKHISVGLLFWYGYWHWCALNAAVTFPLQKLYMKCISVYSTLVDHAVSHFAVITTLPPEIMWTIREHNMISVLWCYEGSTTWTYKKINTISLKHYNIDTVMNWKNLFAFLLQIISSAPWSLTMGIGIIQYTHACTHTRSREGVTERCRQTLGMSCTYQNKKKCPYQHVLRNI
jgi:hypothetical protein